MLCEWADLKGCRDGCNERSVILGWGDGRPAELLYVDYSTAFDFPRANGANPHVCSKVLFTPAMGTLIDPGAVRLGCEQIAALSDDDVGSIVMKIPDELMPEPDRRLLASDLVIRRTKLVEAFDTWYPSC